MKSDIEKVELDRRAAQVVADSNGIEPMYIAFYIQAILYASERAVAAFFRFDSSTRQEEGAAEVVAHVQEALGHTAALSRFFFVGQKSADLPKARARNLRAIFKVSETSPLRDRDLRNGLEHFDERLDKFLLGDIFGYIFPGPMLNNAELADDSRGHIFRMVDPAKETFVLLGEKHEFGEVRSEVSRIADLARTIA